MSDQIIIEIAKVLATWNPLGASANSVDSLDGYKYEAMDIFSCCEIMPGQNKMAAATKQVLEQAFGLSLNEREVKEAGKELLDIMNKRAP
jgi:hypothetical protein